MLNIIARSLEVENPEFRDESFKWINANQEGLALCQHETFVKPLVACLSDKKASIRQSSLEICEIIMGYTGYGPFSKELAKLLPAKQQSVKPLLEKAKSKAIQKPAPVEEKKETLPSA